MALFRRRLPTSQERRRASRPGFLPKAAMVNLDRIARRYSTSPHRIVGLKESDVIGNYWLDLLCAILGGDEDEKKFEERRG